MFDNTDTDTDTDTDIDKNCKTWRVVNDTNCDKPANGNSSTPTIVSLNGQTGVVGYFVTDTTSGKPLLLCIPSATDDSFNTGDTITATNPSGHPGDPAVNGSIIENPDNYTVRLCEKLKTADPAPGPGPGPGTAN